MDGGMATPRIDAVLLDLGNVLVFHDNALLVQRLAERAKTVPETLQKALEGPMADIINKGELGPDPLRQEVCRILGVDIPMLEFKELWSSHFTLNEAVFPVVEALAARAKLVLVSNTNALHWEWLRPRVHLLECFSAFILSHQVRSVKPERAIFEAALARARCRPEHAAFFDDLQPYVDAASNMGIHGRLFVDVPRFEADLEALGLR